MNLLAIWLVGASLTLTYLCLNQLFLVATGRMRVHGINTKADWALLAYQEFNEALKTALAWPMTIPIGMIKTLRYFRKNNIDSLDAATTAALQATSNIGQIQVPPRGERSDAQSEELYAKLQLELDAALGVAPLVKVWPLLTLAWEQLDLGLTEHPMNAELQLTSEQRKRFFAQVVGHMLQHHGTCEEKEGA